MCFHTQGVCPLRSQYLDIWTTPLPTILGWPEPHKIEDSEEQHESKSRLYCSTTQKRNISDSGLRFQGNIIGICFAGRKAGLGNPTDREPGRLQLQNCQTQLSMHSNDSKAGHFIQTAHGIVNAKTLTAVGKLLGLSLRLVERHLRPTFKSI